MERISVDVVSDIACPWCYLGKARLEAAIAEVAGDVAVDVTWRPYQLNPDMPPEGVDYMDHLAGKFGSVARVREAHAQITALGHEIGITYNFPAMKRDINTMDAHRLLHWALIEGPEYQNHLKTLLMKANFTEGRDVSSHDVLLDLAQEAGLDRAVMERLLKSDTDKDVIRDEIASAQSMGVTGVPFFILDKKYGVSGAQTPDVLASALRDIARMKSEDAAAE
jgi:predicted DsbA family dithiol-disulfide isomerase